MEGRRYWIAHVRGPNYEQLRKRGFLVLYPDVDDYVFLEVNPENKGILKKQLELSVSFLKSGSKYHTVSEEEVKRMSVGTSEDAITPGSEVDVINGYCENLSGVVISRNGERLRVELRGYRRAYNVVLDRLDVTLSREEKS